MKYDEILPQITKASSDYKKLAVDKFRNLAIPLNSLGKTQDYVCSICAMTESLSPTIAKRAVVVFCADNGVVTQGISQVDSDVTTAVAKKLCTHETVMCKMAYFSHCSVIPVDIGMKTPVQHKNIHQMSISKGTKDISKTPAMTVEQGKSAIQVGFDMGLKCIEEGYQLLIPGEMGIGNTTTSTAMTCVLLNQNPNDLTGVGAGLSEDGLLKKREVISTAIKINNPNPDDIIDVLSKIGGYDIGGMIGLILACAYGKIPCVIDGYISSLAAYCAISLQKNVADYLIFSHQSAEPGGKALLDAMGVNPILHGNFALGEGSGAVTLLPLLDMGLLCFDEGITFTNMGISPYIPN